MTPTTDQVTGMLDRAIGGGLVWLTGFVLHKLVLAGLLVDGDVTQLSPIIILFGMAAYGWYANRPKAIVQSAASLPGTTVVTTSDLSAATPNQPNIVSNLTNKVVDTKTNQATGGPTPVKTGG